MNSEIEQLPGTASVALAAPEAGLAEATVSVMVEETNALKSANHASPATVRYELRILRALRRIIRSADLYSKHLVATNHITGPQLICLLTVATNGPITASAIARDIHVSTSTVVGILDRLEEKELITRERGREDRRLVHVTATPKGIALAESAPSPLQQSLADAVKALPELEQATIALSLERIADLVGARDTGIKVALEQGLGEQP